MTATVIIETKLMPSFVSSQLLQRRRLVERVLDNLQARLLLVHGEAGAGKSSLLYSYTRQSVSPVAWYSLQEMDQDSKVFLTYLFETIHRTFPGSLNRCRELLAQCPNLDVGWQPIIIALINDVVQYGHRVSVILDDYHLVADCPVIGDMVNLLVKNAPPNLLLILATRRAPELPLPYLRAKGLLVEINGEDLRFSPEDIELLFRDIWRVPIERDVADLLSQKTEGWITGLQLVSQAVRGQKPADVRQFVSQLQGKEQFIYDYLATEVYQLQPSDVRDFMKRTSILSRFNAELARDVSGLTNCAERLEYLETSRLFLVHLDSSREWFRYHHLFGDFLRRKLVLEEGEEKVHSLHIVAGQWLERHGDAASAVPHYLQAEDLEAVVRVLEHQGTEMAAVGLHKSLDAWLDSLPREVLERNPRLILLRGELRELAGQWGRAVDLYERALHHFRAQHQNAEAGAVIERLMQCHLQYGEVGHILEFCESALAECDPQDAAQRSSVCSRFGGILIYSGKDWARGYKLIEESHQLAYKSGDPRAISWACIMYGFCYHFPRGNFLLAEKVFNEGIELFRSLGWSPMLYQLLMNKCVVQVFRGSLERARELIEDTIAMAERAGHAFVVLGLEMTRAMLYLDMGDFHRCQQSFSRMTEKMVPAHIKPWYFRTLMLLHTRQGNLAQAKEAGTEMMRVLAVNGNGMYAPECWVSLAYYYFCQGDLAEAERFIDTTLALCPRSKTKFWEMKAHMLRAALARGERYNVSETRASLKKALAITRENDYADTWLADPLGLSVPLLVEAIAYHSEEKFAGELLERFRETLPDRLVPLLEHSNGLIRSVVVELLGKIGSPDMMDLVRSGRKDPSQAVRATATRTLRSKKSPGNVKIEIYTLGQFQILRNGEPVSLQRRMTQRIFKYLLARFDVGTAREQISETFWPGEDAERSHKSLIMHMNFTRKLLNPDGKRAKFLVALQGGSYFLQLGADVWLDLADFDRLCQEGAQMRREGDLDAAHAKYLRAQALCGGPFLGMDPYDDWLETRRQRVSQQYREALFFLAERAIELNNPGEAVVWYRKQLERDPVDEVTLQSLLRCYAAVGDRPSAKRDYQAFSRVLRAEMDLEPSPETRLLIDRLEVMA